MESILIVEDQPLFGRFLTAIIDFMTPYKARLVDTCFQAIQTAEETPPVLFLLDYRLPEMNGIDLYDHLHTIHALAHIPAILVGADLPHAQIEEDLREREIPGFSKLFEIDELAQMIETLVPSNQAISV